MENARKWLSMVLAIVMMTSCFGGISLAEEDINGGDPAEIVSEEGGGEGVPEGGGDDGIVVVEEGGDETESGNGGEGDLTGTEEDGGDEPAVLTSITLNQTALTLQVGDSATLTPSANDGLSVGEVIWSSSSESVVTVDGGRVTAVGAGEAMVVVTSIVDTSIAASCIVTVTAAEPVVNTLTLDVANAELTIGGSITVAAQLNGEATTDVTWKSDNESVATVADGVISAVGAGSTVITATCGELTATCSVTVTAPVPVLESIALNHETATVVVGDTLELTATPNDGAELGEVIWSSSNETVATVDGGVVTAHAVGTAVITVANGDVSASCTVEVVAPALESITLNVTEIEMLAGEEFTLTATPNDGAELGEVVWSTGDANVATVDNGVVKAIGYGTTTITATCGDITASCNVSVKNVLNSIQLDKAAAKLLIGSTVTLTATPNEGAELGEVTWSSDNETVATVEGGVVTARAAGTAVITVAKGDLSASCTVTVNAPLNGITLNVSDTKLLIGDKLTLTVAPNEGAELGEVVWSSSDPAVATVDNGAITTLKAGATTITASCGGFTASCKISVYAPLTTLSINKTSAALDVKDQLQLTATANEGADISGLTWKSTNSTVATVNADGLVTAVGVGESTIIASCGSFSVKCVVTVTELPDGFELHTPKMTLYPKQKGTIRYALLPANVTDPTVTWVSSDTAVATVSASGVVVGVKNGSCVVTGTTVNGLKIEVPVTVVKKGKAVTSVKLNANKVTLQRTQTKKLKATVSPSKSSDKTITWVSANPAVAMISADGTITAVSPGKTTVMAVASSGVYKSCTVTVKPLAVSKVTLSAKKATVASGETYQLTATLTPGYADNLAVKWTSSKSAVATVDQNGLVTAKKAGTAKITCKSASGVSATCTITVKAVSPVMNMSKKTVTTGDTFQITATYSPATTQDMGLTWYSSKSSVATVDENGVVTAKKSGKAKIYCETKYGKTDYMTVTVKPVSPVMNMSKKTVTTGDTFQITATYSPATTQDMGLTWYSSKSSVATVDENGVVTAKKSGKAKIYCKTKYGQTDYMTVTVKPVTPVMDRSKATMYVGSTLQVGVKLSPATTQATGLAWKTSKPSVAAVNADGVITAMAPGKATITVISESGKTDSVKITVKAVPVSSVTLSNPYGDFAVGGKYKLDVAYAPENAGTKKVKWSSSNKKIAKVNSSTGEITCLKAGTVKITATATDGSKKKATYTITVKAVSLDQFALDVGTITLASGDTFAVGMTVSGELNGVTPYWSSDNDKVATVDQNGVVTGVGSGSTYVRCTVGGNVRTVKVIVPQSGDTSYRVLVAGEYTSSKTKGYLNFAANGLHGVADAFDLANIYGDRYQELNLNNPSEGTLLSSINTFFDDADSDDVSVLYLMSHGLNVNGEYRWGIAGSKDYVTEAELTGALEQIDGEVVLVLVSCYSGQYLDNYVDSEASASLKGALTNVNGSREGDKKISVITSVTGEMKGGYVDQTAATAFDFFTLLFNKALGWDQQSSSAYDTLYGDLNGDGNVTLSELVQYIDANYQSTINQHMKDYGTQSVANNRVQKMEYYLTTPDLTIYSRAKAKIASN